MEYILGKIYTWISTIVTFFKPIHVKIKKMNGIFNLFLANYFLSFENCSYSISSNIKMIEGVFTSSIQNKIFQYLNEKRFFVFDSK